MRAVSSFLLLGKHKVSVVEVLAALERG